MNKWLLLVVLLISGCSLFSPPMDCAPATLHRMFPSKSISELKRGCNTDRNGSYFPDVIKTYYAISTNKLYLLYPLKTNGVLKTDIYIETYKNYLWFGFVYDKGIKCGHACIIMFTDTNILLSNSQYIPNTTNYYITTMKYGDFFTNTVFLFNTKDLNNVRFY
jgi:hypothetical protein